MYHTLGRRGLLAATAGSVARRLLISSGEGSGSLSAGAEVAYICVSIALVIVSGLAAGLTLGLLSLDRVDLEVIKRTGTSKQQWLVSRVEPLLTNPHYLLVSLLLVNAACYETLPIFLDRLLNPVAAILISVTAILIFGEIAPQAICKRYSLQIGAYSSWAVRAVMIITFPISYPLGKVLDWILGEETALFRRPELRALVTIHAEPDEDGGESMLTAEEVQVIHGALDMAHKTAETAMTPLHVVFAVGADEIVNDVFLKRILEAGHSRVPVYEQEDSRNIIGLILVKELILVDLTQNVRVRDCRMRDIDYIFADTPLYSVMELFRLKRRHMAVLVKNPRSSDVNDKMDQVVVPVPVNGGALTDGDLLDISAPPPIGAEVVLKPIFNHKAPEAGNPPEDGPIIHPRPPSAQPLKPPIYAANKSTASLHSLALTDQPKIAESSDVIGVITIEDVIEELLAIEIIDETDVWIDNTQTQRVPTAERKDLPPSLKRYVSRGHIEQRRAMTEPAVVMNRTGSFAGGEGKTSSRPQSPEGIKQSKVVAAAAGAAYAFAATSNKARNRSSSENLGIELGGVSGERGNDSRPTSSLEGQDATESTGLNHRKGKSDQSDTYPL